VGSLKEAEKSSVRMGRKKKKGGIKEGEKGLIKSGSFQLIGSISKRTEGGKAKESGYVPGGGEGRRADGKEESQKGGGVARGWAEWKNCSVGTAGRRGGRGGKGK